MATKKPDHDRDYAEITVRKAMAGNAAAARELLEDFSNEVDRHSERAWEAIERSPRHYCQARYFAECFRAILDGEDPRKALNLANPAKRPRGTTRIPYTVLAAMFYYLVRQGLSASTAKEEIAEQMHVDAMTVQRAKREWPMRPGFAAKSGEEIDEDEILKAIFHSHGRHVSAILKRQKLEA